MRKTKARRQARFSPPIPRKEAELILKRNCEFGELEVRSGTFLLGNKAGWRWLSAYCEWLSNGIDERAPFVPGDPDNHQHLNGTGPFNNEMSDVFGFMVGTYSRKNRHRVLKAVRCTPRQSLGGHPIRQFREDLEHLTNALPLLDGRIRAETTRELELLLRQAKASLTKIKAARRLAERNGRESDSL